MKKPKRVAASLDKGHGVFLTHASKTGSELTLMHASAVSAASTVLAHFDP